MLAAMRWCDVTFVCDPTHIPEALLPNIRRLEFLTFACDPAFHCPVTVSEEERARFGGVACFVGNWQGAESPRYHYLRHLAGYPINVWGRGWQESDLARHGLHVMNQSVYQDEMLKVYSSNLIALNFSFDQYLNLRNFEVPACGPLLITTAVPQIEEYFRPDEEIVTFENSDDLRAKVGYYILHPEIAARVARRGMERAHREHTYQKRMAEMLDKIGR
jgi:spore maturation protein CgeB